MRSSFLCLGWIMWYKNTYLFAQLSLTLEATVEDYWIGLLTSRSSWAVLYRNQRRNHFYEDNGSNCNCIYMGFWVTLGGFQRREHPSCHLLWLTAELQPCITVKGMGMIEGCCKLSEGSVSYRTCWNTRIWKYNRKNKFACRISFFF